MGTLAAVAVAVALLMMVNPFLSVAKSQSISYPDWTGPAYNSYNTNFDPQTVINSSNVQNLQVKWIYQVPENPYDIPGAAPALGIETTPLIINGIVYFATPYNRITALVASTGALLWSYQVNLDNFLNDSWWAEAYTISSLSYYGGVIYFMASDTSVYGLSALNGSVVFKIPNTGANVPGNTGYYFGEKAPLIYGDLMIVRASSTDYGGRGYVDAYNVKTKQLVWQWFSVPPSGGQADWDQNATLGNIQAYPGDWGNNSLIGGGSAWGLMTVDNQTGILYFSTGHPSDLYNADLRPGPNLYTDCIIALNITTGDMVWYYQINPHDLTEHEGGWSITLANITYAGKTTRVIIQAAKNNYIYILDAATGKPVYSPIEIGSPNSNVPNDNAGNAANLTSSQFQMVGSSICPGTDGGVEMAPALDGNNFFVASQNACGEMSSGKLEYKSQTITGFIYQGNPAASQNSTLYSIDLSTRTINWEFLMPDRYQAASAVASGGVIYAVDRDGTLYALNEKNGALLKSINLNGLGAAGVSIGEDGAGEMMVFVPAGGGDLPTSTPGILLGLYVPASASSSSSSISPYLSELPEVGLGVCVIVLSAYILVTRSKKRTMDPSPPSS